MGENRKYRIMMVEPSEIISGGLVPIVESTGEFSVAFVTSSLPQNDTDLSNFDIFMIDPSAEGFDSVWRLKQSVRSRAVVLIGHTALPERVEENADAIIGIYDSRPKIIRKLRGAVEDASSETAAPEEANELSAREKEILAAVARGLTNKEIADLFNISVHTVMSHRKNITAKLGINSISGLTVYAVINKLIEI